MQGVIAFLIIVLAGCASSMEEKSSPEVELYINEVTTFPLSFTVPKLEEEEAWGRAHIFVSRYSSIPITKYTRSTILTIEPVRHRAQYGYHVTKSVEGENVRIRVECLCGKDTLEKSMVMNARILAYFIKTGKLPYPELIKR